MEPVERHGQLGHGQGQPIVPGDVRHLVQQDRAQPLDRPCGGFARQQNYWTKRAQGHWHDAAAGVEHSDAAHCRGDRHRPRLASAEPDQPGPHREASQDQRRAQQPDPRNPVNWRAGWLTVARGGQGTGRNGRRNARRGRSANRRAPAGREARKDGQKQKRRERRCPHQMAGGGRSPSQDNAQPKGCHQNNGRLQ